MRTTIYLADALLRRAKARAAAAGCTLNDFISDAVRAALAPRASDHRSAELPTFKGGKMLPGVDLDDSSALLDLMENRDLYQTKARSKRGAAAKVAERPRDRE